jgi:hypothetical protein
MPADPLSSKEAMAAFIQRARAAGKTDDDIRRFVAQKRGGEPYTPPPDIAEPPPSGMPREVEEMRAAGSRAEQQQILKEGALMGIGGLAGGVAGEAAGMALIPRVARTAHTIKRILATAGRIAPEIAGEAAGTYAGGRLAEVPPEAAEEAAMISAVGGLAGRTIARVGTRFAGRAASMRPETVQAGIEDPSLLRAPEPDAELAQAQRLGAQLEAQRAEITPAHAAYQKQLASKGDVRVEGNDILDVFQKNIAGRDNKPSLAADREVRRMADKFIDRLGPDSKIGLAELDDYIRQEFTKPLVGQYAKESEAVAAKRMMDVRRDLTDLLYDKVGPGAAPAQGLAGRAIRTREAVENVFDLGKETRPTGTAAERIRGILGDSGEAQKNRAVLTAYDEQYGTRHLEDAKRLARQREWQGKDLETAYAIDSALQPTRPGFIRGLALPVARGGARIARVAGPVTSAIVAGTQAERRKKKEKK